MHVRASSQLFQASPSSLGNSISFAASVSLSAITTAAALIRLGGWCLSANHRPWSFWVCATSVLASAGTLGVACSKRIDDDSKYRDAYSILLLVNCGLLVIYEGGFMWHLYAKFNPIAQKIGIGIMGLTCLIVIGLSLWLMIRSDKLSSILEIQLSANCGAYLVLGTGYVHIFASTVRKSSVNGSSFTRWFLLANAVLCLLVLIFTGIFLILGSIGRVPGGMIVPTWIYYTITSICTIRFQVLQALKQKASNSLSVSNKPDEEFGFEDQSSIQGSSTALVMPPPVHMQR